MSAQIRHDIPGTQIAWSAYVQYRHYTPYFYLTEVYTEQDLPWIAGFYVEDKNVMGASVRFTVDNVFNGRHYYDRTIYDGFRDRTPIAYYREPQCADRAAVLADGEGHLLSARGCRRECHAQDRSHRRSSKPIAPAIPRRSTPTWRDGSGGGSPRPPA